MMGEEPGRSRHRTARQFAYDQIVEAITDGSLSPGARLNEQQLSEWLDISRTPIREALSALAGDGVVELIAHQGGVVRTLNPEDLRDEYVLRAALESLAVELSVPMVPDAELDQLVELNRSMDDALHNGQLREFLSMNRHLHLRLYSYCESPRLLALIESSWDREDIFRRHYYSHAGARDTETHMHDELLDAYRRRAAAEARELVKRSLLATGEALVHQISHSAVHPTAHPAMKPERNST